VGPLDPSNIRDTLWTKIQSGIFEAHALEELGQWVLQHRDALLHSADRPEDEKVGWVGGETDPELGGPRCFIRRWQPEEFIGRHTHPNGMLIVLLQGALEIGEGWDDANEETLTLAPETVLVRLADEGGFEHFPHTMKAAATPTVSLHLYSGSPNKGRAVD